MHLLCFPQHTFNHPDVVTDCGQKTLTDVVSATEVTSRWTCRPSRAATRDSCKSRWWQCVSSLEIQEGLQTVGLQFPIFQQLSPFLRFTLVRIRGQQHVVEKSCRGQKWISWRGKHLLDHRSVPAAYKSNSEVLFILLLKYLLTDNKGWIYAAVKTSVPEWYWEATEDHFMDWVQ